MLAVLVLSWAGAQSALMQLAALMPVAMDMSALEAMADCPEMMPEADAHAPADRQKPPHEAPCPICSIAAHLPVPVVLPPIIIHRVMYSVRFLHQVCVQPRGPPAEPSRARGPPAPVFLP